MPKNPYSSPGFTIRRGILSLVQVPAHRSREMGMNTVVEAVYEKGMLKLAQPLSLPEGMRVRLTIAPTDQDVDPLAPVIGICDGPPDGAENHNKYIYRQLRP